MRSYARRQHDIDIRIARLSAILVLILVVAFALVYFFGWSMPFFNFGEKSEISRLVPEENDFKMNFQEDQKDIVRIEKNTTITGLLKQKQIDAAIITKVVDLMSDVQADSLYEGDLITLWFTYLDNSLEDEIIFEADSITTEYSVNELINQELIDSKLADSPSVIAEDASEEIESVKPLDDKFLKIVSFYIKRSGKRYEVFYDDHKKDYDLRVTDSILSIKIENRKAVLGSSFYVDAMRVGIPRKLIMDMVGLYSYDLDFQRDIMPGDTLQVMFETYYNEEGESVDTGDVVYAKLTAGNRNFYLYRFAMDNGEYEYFNEQGHSARKGLLRTPINGVRISSGFGYRKHPILGYNSLHEGIDFAAPVGTPIMAAGDGVISKLGWFGSYGNYISIKHNGKHTTAYAHMHGFRKGLKQGDTVKQGDIIGYVGNTGRSTGPHLHYEIIENNKKINPAKLKIEPAVVLDKSKIVVFKNYKEVIDSVVAFSLPDSISNLDVQGVAELEQEQWVENAIVNESTN